jgi:hypothetical protein
MTLKPVDIPLLFAKMALFCHFLKNFIHRKHIFFLNKGDKVNYFINTFWVIFNFLTI